MVFWVFFSHFTYTWWILNHVSRGFSHNLNYFEKMLCNFVKQFFLSLLFSNEKHALTWKNHGKMHWNEELLQCLIEAHVFAQLLVQCFWKEDFFKWIKCGAYNWTHHHPVNWYYLNTLIYSPLDFWNSHFYWSGRYDLSFRLLIKYLCKLFGKCVLKILYSLLR